MAITITLLIVGLILIIWGGNFFVDAASWIAKKTGIPELIVGATVVSIATTLPELLVSVIAASNGSVDMAVGNAAGTVAVNIGLIMALAMIFMPTKISAKEYKGKFILLLLAAIISVIGGLMGAINLPMAIALLAITLLFFFDNVRSALSGQHEAGAKKPGKKSSALRAKSGKRLALKNKVWWNIVKFVLGGAGIVGGAQLLVNSGTELATMLGVSERIISVTLIAVGTSLPELVTMITALIKREGALSFGNLLGASIIDISLIMPLAAIISGQALPISNKLAAIDVPACLIISAIAVIPTAITKKFSRWQGLLLIATYGVYMFVTCII